MKESLFNKIANDLKNGKRGGNVASFNWELRNHLVFLHSPGSNLVIGWKHKIIKRYEQMRLF